MVATTGAVIVRGGADIVDRAIKADVDWLASIGAVVLGELGMREEEVTGL